jgi:hypothetical protein
MKKFNAARAVLVFLAVFLGVLPGYTQTSVSFDAQTRLRYEYLGNNFDLGASGSDRRSYFRFRFSGAIGADFGGLAKIYGKLTSESRSYIYNAGGSARYDISEAVIDSLFISVPKIFDSLEIQAGRFDLSGYGEGFLIADGTPMDGSRTSYFNAVKFKFLDEEGNSVEFMGIYNPQFDDLPVINDKKQRLNDSGETAFIIYGKTKPSDKLYLEPYYIWKAEKPSSGAAVSNAETSINVFGAYAKYDFEKFSLRGQAAFQTGNYDNKTGSAFGGYAYADIPVCEVIKPLSFGYSYLSGDNSGSEAVEAWNPVFSRYPWMSEIMASLYAAESGIGYWTNLSMLRAEGGFVPFKKTSLKAAYAYMLANQSYGGVAPAGIFGNGKNRGSLFTCRISYDISENAKAYLHGEYFIPGDYYYEGAKDAVFFRAELSAKI